MARIEKPKAYRVDIIESERGWGREYWQEVFDTYDEAKARIKEINSKNLNAQE